MKTQRCWSIFLLLTVLASLSLVRCNCNEFPECDSDEECVAYNQGVPFCVDRTCVGCRDGADCEGCSECRQNACREFACCSDPDCGYPNSGQICQDHRCLGGCRNDDDCPDGFCEANQCVQCRTDADCEENFRCDNNRCVSTLECADRELRTALFDFDEDVIRRSEETTLRRNATCLSEFPDDQIRIEGHCDERGTDAYNMALGERRARAAKRFLTTEGVAESRITIISYGESRPADPGHTERAWTQNRRTEFVWR